MRSKHKQPKRDFTAQLSLEFQPSTSYSELVIVRSTEVAVIADEAALAAKNLTELQENREDARATQSRGRRTN